MAACQNVILVLLSFTTCVLSLSECPANLGTSQSTSPISGRKLFPVVNPSSTTILLSACPPISANSNEDPITVVKAPLSNAILSNKGTLNPTVHNNAPTLSVKVQSTASATQVAGVPIRAPSKSALTTGTSAPNIHTHLDASPVSIPTTIPLFPKTLQATTSASTNPSPSIQEANVVDTNTANPLSALTDIGGRVLTSQKTIHSSSKSSGLAGRTSQRAVPPSSNILPNSTTSNILSHFANSHILPNTTSPATQRTFPAADSGAGSVTALVNTLQVQTLNVPTTTTSRPLGQQSASASLLSPTGSVPILGTPSKVPNGPSTSPIFSVGKPSFEQLSPTSPVPAQKTSTGLIPLWKNSSLSTGSRGISLSLALPASSITNTFTSSLNGPASRSHLGISSNIPIPTTRVGDKGSDTGLPTGTGVLVPSLQIPLAVISSTGLTSSISNSHFLPTANLLSSSSSPVPVLTNLSRASLSVDSPSTKISVTNSNVLILFYGY
ncbi:hypothetical protein EG329_012402 [Mollisiaceae sp. DMI_Dod_QoI]|nr:hypothetical protein EG329_012402 [Helotiales sp. DMI_Dod_QoI]